LWRRSKHTIYVENRVVYELMWKNVLEPGWSQMTTWRIAGWIPKATDTHS